MAKCGVVYSGPTYPQHHGLACEHEGSHEGTRHYASVLNADGSYRYPLSWWTEEEKVGARARRAARAKEE
jgi:hypothetical protein